ncbi:hypothetical protein DdX_20321 [Ditylenchus destructor]|uniref:Uncharacterized protein n=1 Tax=Ditylenchus destructor TaxID=166010 RepID=A0AAD4MI87_9BILA|nr:hypothetical protein DdX_20321 [Ditylenchus destructor]
MYFYFTSAWRKFEIHQSMQLTDNEGKPLLFENYREQLPEDELCGDVIVRGGEKLKNVKLSGINGIVKNEKGRQEIIELDCGSKSPPDFLLDLLRVEVVLGIKNDFTHAESNLHRRAGACAPSHSAIGDRDGITVIPLSVSVYKLKNDQDKKGTKVGSVTLGPMSLDFQIWDAIKNHQNKDKSKPWKDVKKIIHYDTETHRTTEIKEDYTIRYNHSLSSRKTASVLLRIGF